MAVERHSRLSTVLAKVLTFCRDPGGVRYPPDVIVDGLRDAINELAEAGVFQRWDLHAPTAEQALFEYQAEPVRVASVDWNGKPLHDADEQHIRDCYGQNWRQVAGTPEYFLNEGHRLRLVPKPEDAGDALVFDSPTARTEDEYRGLAADGFWSALDGSDFVLFRPGDGQVTNDEDGENLLLVRYSYHPLSPGLEQTFQLRYELGLKGYGIRTAYATARTPEAVQRYTVGQTTWIKEKRKLIEAAAGPVGEDFSVSVLAEMG